MTANAHPLIQQMASDSSTVLMVRRDYTYELPSLRHLCILIPPAGLDAGSVAFFSFFFYCRRPICRSKPWLEVRCAAKSDGRGAEWAECGQSNWNMRALQRRTHVSISSSGCRRWGGCGCCVCSLQTPHAQLVLQPLRDWQWRWGVGVMYGLHALSRGLCSWWRLLACDRMSGKHVPW